MYRVTFGSRTLLNSVGAVRHGITLRYLSKNANRKVGGTILTSNATPESTTVSFLTDDCSGAKPFTVCFNNIFLRDASRSSDSVDADTGQKLFTTGQLASEPRHFTPEKVDITENGQALSITWRDGDHYDYPLEFLYRYKGSTYVSRSLRNQSSKHKPVIWDATLFNKHLDSFRYKYNEYMTDDKVLYQTLIKLQKFGIVMITDLPELSADLDPLQDLCHRVGPLRKTIYGEVFEVDNTKPNHSNITFSNKRLPFHQDLTYLENVPGFQILQCARNETAGGENIYVDAFNATRHIRETDTEAYEALQIVPVNYSYKKDDKRYYQSKPIIEQFDSNEHNVEISNYEYLIKQINYSPPYQAPFTYGIYNKAPQKEVSTTPGKTIERFTFKDFVRGLEMFEDSINNPANQLMMKIPKNCAVIFNNRRILHARNEIFSSEASRRIFRGCFFSNDHFRSRLKYLEERFD
ncbi:Aim17p KNAG_0D04670 [Huiozyma naganishii CBS 8797]|uniref:TauD/TfdA-like domain-containing protein n=1 Tax=Huiozyma naganishii (strain ATCC MYA-139 / BCRC 22969 / CBS 8797 / KCTC 17520 / NBRC 10181 / NCYC 3082 / Yp74L-3) TaxID=1071383 RepID=J7RYG8_HUIN7|nr:hypothetical protein KNAG_0D04670 [Kazachstania naganishii CBS 8797]CCK70207.1 hypothetical protein KNAG_0D04670 [Kazachstania naganishii CBS 8797]